MKVLGNPTILTNYDTAQSPIKQKVDGYITDLSIAGIVDGVIKLYCNDNMREGLGKNCLLRDYSNNQELNKLYFLF